MRSIFGDCLNFSNIRDKEVSIGDLMGIFKSLIVCLISVTTNFERFNAKLYFGNIIRLAISYHYLEIN